MRAQERLNPQYFHIRCCAIWHPYLIPRSRHFAKVSPWFPSLLKNDCGFQPSLVVVSKRYVILWSQIASKVLFQPVLSFYAPFIFCVDHFLNFLFNFLHYCFYFMFCFSFCIKACGILALWPGIEATPLALEGEVLTTGPPKESFRSVFVSEGSCSDLEIENSVAVVWRPGWRMLVQETPYPLRINHEILHSKTRFKKLLGVNDWQAHHPVEQMHCRTHGKRTNQGPLRRAQPLGHLMEKGQMELSGKVGLEDASQRGEFMEFLQWKNPLKLSYLIPSWNELVAEQVFWPHNWMLFH